MTVSPTYLARKIYGPGVTGTGPFSWAGILVLDSGVVAEKDQFVVAKNGVTLTEGTDYTFNPSPTETITLTTALIATDVLQITRDTLDTSRYVDFQDASTVTESDLDLSADQNFFLSQEALDFAKSAMVVNVEGNWEGCNKASDNCLPSIGPNSWVTRAEAETLMNGGDVAQISSAAVYSFTGDGATTEFELDNGTTTEIGSNTNLAFVYVNGVLQHADSETVYSIENEGDGGHPGGSENDYLVFTTAPDSGDKVEARFLNGTIVTSQSTGSIDTDAIADDAVGLAHINVGSGVADRFLVFDTDGDPTARVMDHTDMSDFDTEVEAKRLDQFAVPAADLDINNQKLTSVGDPTAAQDAATKNWVDGQISALSVPQMASGSSTHASSVGTWKEVTGLGFRPRKVDVMSYTGTYYMTFTFCLPDSSEYRHGHFDLGGSNDHDSMSCQSMADGFRVKLHDNNQLSNAFTYFAARP